MIKTMVLCSFQIIPSHRLSLLHSIRKEVYLNSFYNQRFLHLKVNTNQMQQRKLPVMCNTIPSGLPSGPPSGSCWKSWILGIAITVILPFLTNKWGPLLKLKNEVDTVVETAERVVDEVEKVAEEVENVTEELADDLPAGTLKNAASKVEHLAEATEKDAKLIGDFIDKVQEIEEKVDNLVESNAREEADISKSVSELAEAKQAMKETKLDQDHKEYE